MGDFENAAGTDVAFFYPLGFRFAKALAQAEIIMANTPATRNPQEQRMNPGQTFGDIKDKAHDVAGTVADKTRETTSAICGYSSRCGLDGGGPIT
jgi:hypothetical protein